MFVAPFKIINEYESHPASPMGCMALGQALDYIEACYEAFPEESAEHYDRLQRTLLCCNNAFQSFEALSAKEQLHVLALRIKLRAYPLSLPSSYNVRIKRLWENLRRCFALPRCGWHKKDHLSSRGEHAPQLTGPLPPLPKTVLERKLLHELAAWISSVASLAFMGGAQTVITQKLHEMTLHLVEDLMIAKFKNWSGQSYHEETNSIAHRLTRVCINGCEKFVLDPLASDAPEIVRTTRNLGLSILEFTLVQSFQRLIAKKPEKMDPQLAQSLMKTIQLFRAFLEDYRHAQNSITKKIKAIHLLPQDTVDLLIAKEMKPKYFETQQAQEDFERGKLKTFLQRIMGGAVPPIIEAKMIELLHPLINQALQATFLSQMIERCLPAEIDQTTLGKAVPEPNFSATDGMLGKETRELALSLIKLGLPSTFGKAILSASQPLIALFDNHIGAGVQKGIDTFLRDDFIERALSVMELHLERGEPLKCSQALSEEDKAKLFTEVREKIHLRLGSLVKRTLSEEAPFGTQEVLSGISLRILDELYTLTLRERVLRLLLWDYLSFCD